MDKLLGLVLLVVSASVLIIMHGFSDHRRLFDSRVVSNLLRLASRLKSKASISHSELTEVLRHFKLPCGVFHFRLCHWFAGCKLAELIKNFDIPNPVNPSNLRELIGRFRDCCLAGQTKFSEAAEVEPSQTAKDPSQLDLEVLNCRVRLTTKKEAQSASNVFVVEIAGSIRTPSDMHYATLRISIVDVTEGVPRARPVQAQVKRWQAEHSPEFCYKADLGKLPNKVTTLSDWTTVAQLDTNWLKFPRKGRRNLQFTTAILSRQSGQELAGAECVLTYENPGFGYIDLQENSQRVKTLAVALAFAVSASDQRLYDCEVELIKDWARDNIGPYRPMPDGVRSSEPESAERRTRTANKAGRRLERALTNAAVFFQTGNKLDLYEICREIAELVPVADRYNVLDLCLRVARAKGFVALEELAILKDIATWLEVDGDRFRVMVQKTLPITIHQSKDVEALLGVTSNMDKDKTRRRLNNEYGKWNSRVTSSDPEVQVQADQMLKLIAETRSEYIG
jgi:tellurite resistance protein